MKLGSCRAWVPTTYYRDVGLCDCKLAIQDGYCVRHRSRAAALQPNDVARLVCRGCGATAGTREGEVVARACFQHAFARCGGKVVLVAARLPESVKRMLGV